MGLSCYALPVPLFTLSYGFNALMGLSCYSSINPCETAWYSFNALMGLSCYCKNSNILNFSWYFLCIPAIYRYILAYLPIFFNQLSEFFRCESPSTFLGTCLSHHSFIIFLVTSTNALLMGLYLIFTWHVSCRRHEMHVWGCQCPLGLIPHFYWAKSLYEMIVKGNRCQCPLGLIPHFYMIPYYDQDADWWFCVNALSGLYLISTDSPDMLYRTMFDSVSMPSRAYTSFLRCTYECYFEWRYRQCQCPLGLIPHFYSTPSKT